MFKLVIDYLKCDSARGARFHGIPFSHFFCELYTTNQEAVYWTPQWEYPDMIKIGFHGNAMVKSDPDKRDQNIESDRKRNIEIVSDFIKKSFPGVEFENGPSITETCYYTVCILSYTVNLRLIQNDIL